MMSTRCRRDVPAERAALMMERENMADGGWVDRQAGRQAERSWGERARAKGDQRRCERSADAS